MKKLILLPLLFLVFFPRNSVFAQSGSGSAVVSPTPIQSGPTPMVVNYTLPYPGILPNNPLYTLKAIRDGLIAFFISDPLKKSEFYLLQSDKRVASSWYLLQADRSNTALALSTLSKSTNYFQLALAQAQLAQRDGEDANGIKTQLVQAGEKHLSVVMQIQQLPGLTNNQTLLSEQERLGSLEKSVVDFSSKQ